MAKRRGRGEGSISQRSDGRWQGLIDLGWQGGRRDRKSLYGRTRAEVQNKLDRARHALSEGQPVPGNRQTVEQFLADWLVNVARPRVRPRTYVTYEEVLRLHVIPYIGRVQLAKLTPQRIQAWLGDREKAGVSASRRRYARTVLRTALQQAVKWSLIPRNVAVLVDAPRVQRREITPFDQGQVRQLLKACDQHRLGALFLVQVALGLRQGEVLGLRLVDVDLEGGVLRVRQALQRQRRAGLVFVELKSEASRRSIALPQMVITALKRHRVRQLEERLVAGCQWVESGLVFTTQDGKPVDPRNTNRVFDRLLANARLPHIRVHDLRHTFATLLLEQGVSPRVVMEMLGHSQIGLTLNTYSHVLPALQREAAHRIDAAIGGT